MSKMNFLVVLLFCALALPNFVFADGGMMIWPPKVHLNQSAQNAIVAWNGQEEIIILSNDIESDESVTALRMVPLPSKPSDIKEGDFESFEKITEIMNEKIEKIQTPNFGREGDDTAAGGGVEIVFHEKIGAHDVTVVKVNDLDYFLDWTKDFAEGKGLEVKEISTEFRNGISNYLKRDIKHFVFDVIDTKQGEESINPLIYKFDSDYLYYPILISGVSEISESRANIQVFLITEDEILNKGYWRPYQRGYFSYPVEFSQEELQEVSEDVAGLFDSKVKVTSFDYYGSLNQFTKDLVFYPQIWQKNLGKGSFGDDVKALQKILINEGLWDAEVGATGYFGRVTENALVKLQEMNKPKILEPSGLKKGNGYFGARTREVLQQSISLTTKSKTTSAWNRNLSLGMRGDDVKELQKILIAEKVWQRSDVKPSGYFGKITKNAVIKFQEKYSSEILESVGLIKGTGFVGPSTLNYLKNK
jgi:peptidoglycan hydrolase-like protein with peptidoglycan-binding domain